jgi:hypothetical protein
MDVQDGGVGPLFEEKKLPTETKLTSVKLKISKFENLKNKTAETTSPDHSSNSRVTKRKSKEFEMEKSNFIKQKRNINDYKNISAPNSLGNESFFLDEKMLKKTSEVKKQENQFKKESSPKPIQKKENEFKESFSPTSFELLKEVFTLETNGDSSTEDEQPILSKTTKKHFKKLNVKENSFIDDKNILDITLNLGEFQFEMMDMPNEKETMVSKIIQESTDSTLELANKIQVATVIQTPDIKESNQVIESEINETFQETIQENASTQRQKKKLIDSKPYKRRTSVETSPRKIPPRKSSIDIFGTYFESPRGEKESSFHSTSEVNPTYTRTRMIEFTNAFNQSFMNTFPNTFKEALKTNLPKDATMDDVVKFSEVFVHTFSSTFSNSFNSAFQYHLKKIEVPVEENERKNSKIHWKTLESDLYNVPFKDVRDSKKNSRSRSLTRKEDVPVVIEEEAFIIVDKPTDILSFEEKEDLMKDLKKKKKGKKNHFFDSNLSAFRFSVPESVPEQIVSPPLSPDSSDKLTSPKSNPLASPNYHNLTKIEEKKRSFGISKFKLKFKI